MIVTEDKTWDHHYELKQKIKTGASTRLNHKVLNVAFLRQKRWLACVITYGFASTFEFEQAVLTFLDKPAAIFTVISDIIYAGSKLGYVVKLTYFSMRIFIRLNCHSFENRFVIG